MTQNASLLEKMKGFAKNKKGQGGIVMSVIVVLMLVAVGALIVFTMLDSLQSSVGNNSAANSTIQNVQNTSSTVFNLLTVMAIVLVASAIIGVVYYAFGRGGGGGIPPTGY